MVSLFISLEWVFIFCYLATRATTAMTTIPRYVYDVNWYEYPLELREYCQIVLMRSQQPFYFTGFKVIKCTLETFTKVLNEY